MIYNILRCWERNAAEVSEVYQLSSWNIMYWNNPLVEAYWPGDRDPVADSLHSGTHCLFYNPAAEFKHIKTNQRLADLIKWANEWLAHDGIDGFAADTRNHYDMANLVKLNMWVRDIKQQGIVKPWLILDDGDGSYTAGTGDSRLRALECIPEISTVSAFISTRAERAELYAGLESVTQFDRFAELCGAEPHMMFVFRLTDPAAPYGMYWYEFNSSRTRAVTPGETDAVNMFINYVRRNPSLVVTKEYFSLPVDWDSYTE